MTGSLSSSQLQRPVPVVSGQLLRVLGRGVAFLWRRQLQTLRRGESNLGTPSLMMCFKDIF